MLTTGAVLVVFLGVTGWVLDRTFSQSVINGAQQQLQLVVYSLMGSASEENQQLRFIDSLAEPRLSQPDSGLYALVRNDRGQTLWRSRSAVLTDVFQSSEMASTSGGFTFEQLRQATPRFSCKMSALFSLPLPIRLRIVRR